MNNQPQNPLLEQLGAFPKPQARDFVSATAGTQPVGPIKIPVRQASAAINPLGELTNSPGVITRAVQAGGIAAVPQTDPDTDGRRQYSPNYGDAFAYRGGSFAPTGPSNGPDSTALNPLVRGVAEPNKTGDMPVLPRSERGIAQLPANRLVSEVVGAVNQGADAVGKPDVRPPLVTHDSANTAGNAGVATMPSGRNEQGVITADSAAAAIGNPMTRSGGIAGSYDGKGVNEILARENKARAGMIDSMISANGGNGIAILGGDGPTEAEKINAERTQRWRQDELLGLANRGNHSAVAAAIQANAQAGTESIRGQNQLTAEQGRNAVTMRGQDLSAQSDAAKMASNPLRQLIDGERYKSDVRMNDLQARYLSETDPAKRDEIAGQIRAISGKAEVQADTLTLPQRRSNAEIDAARMAIAGLTPEEIKRKTANFTETGRENPDFDPTLAKSVALANRRKYGEDGDFDQRQQPQAKSAVGSDGDVMTRFRADQGMQGHKPGKQTDQGLEVFDASGKLIGHYR